MAIQTRQGRWAGWIIHALSAYSHDAASRHALSWGDPLAAESRSTSPLISEIRCPGCEAHHIVFPPDQCEARGRVESRCKTSCNNRNIGCPDLGLSFLEGPCRGLPCGFPVDKASGQGQQPLQRLSHSRRPASFQLSHVPGHEQSAKLRNSVSPSLILPCPCPTTRPTSPESSPATSRHPEMPSTTPKSSTRASSPCHARIPPSTAPRADARRQRTG